MVAAVLAANPDAEVAAAIVWLPMIRGDSEAAVPEAMSLVSDERATHFYDPEHVAGRAIAASIGAADQIAWDMYLFYERSGGGMGDAEAARVPRPAAWFHQLRGCEWAGVERYRWGEALAESLSELAAARWSAAVRD